MFEAAFMRAVAVSRSVVGKIRNGVQVDSATRAEPDSSFSLLLSYYLSSDLISIAYNYQTMGVFSILFRTLRLGTKYGLLSYGLYNLFANFYDGQSIKYWLGEDGYC